MWTPCWLVHFCAYQARVLHQCKILHCIFSKCWKTQELISLEIWNFQETLLCECGWEHLDYIERSSWSSHACGGKAAQILPCKVTLPEFWRVCNMIQNSLGAFFHHIPLILKLSETEPRCTQILSFRTCPDFKLNALTKDIKVFFLALNP